MRKVYFKDIFDVSSGLSKGAKELANGDNPFLSFKTIFSNTFIPESLTDKANTTESEQIKYSVLKGDVFLTRTSETTNELGMSSVALKDYPHAVFNGFSKRLRPKANITIEWDLLYLGYYLRSRFFRDQVDAMSNTSTRASLNKEMIDRLFLYLPDIKTQHRVGSFLYTIDQKITTNQRINQNLSQQLHTLYLEFLSNEPMDRTLGDCVATTSGGTPSRKHDEYYEHGDICWIKSKELLGSYIHDTEEHINDLAVAKSSAKLLPSHSVLIAMYGATVGAYAITSKPMTCNQAICALLCNDEYPYTYLFQLAHESQQTIVNLAVGSAQQNVSQVLIKQLPIHSCKEAIRKFHELALPIHMKTELLEAENIRLSEMRNNLLPKLMSGEIDVSEIEIKADKF